MDSNGHWQKQKQSRPTPAFNPYRNTSRQSSRSDKSTVFIKQHLLPIVFLSSLLAIWFLTPLSDFIASIILVTVPASSDVQLGLESWHAMKKKHPNKYQITHDRWNVESIGYDLVNSVIFNERNLNNLCHSITTPLLDSVFNTKQLCKNQALNYNWSFQVVRSSDINAFALPGGIICVTDTLLKTLELSRGEIAALLGHEMSHVLHRHGQSQLLKKNLFQTIVKALFYDDNDDHDENFAEAVNELLLKGASFLGEMKFSRKNEFEADNGAWDILMYSEKYNPVRVQYLLQKLYSLEGGTAHASGRKEFQSNAFSAWDKTHPGTGDRIEIMRQKWNKLSWSKRRQFEKLY